MGRYVTLKRSGMAAYVEGRTQGYRMQVEVVEASGLPTELFVHYRRPHITAQGPVDTFENVASPNDIEEYPVGDVGDPTVPFYRLAALDLVARNPADLESVWVGIKDDIEELIATLNYMDNLTVQEEVTLGDAPTSSSSSSSES